jgi:hypothetical protein
MGIRMEMCPLLCVHLKNPAILLVARRFRRNQRHIYWQILPSVGWNWCLFEQKFALLTGSLVSHAFWKQYAYLRSLQRNISAHPTVVFSCCRIQHVSCEGKHGNLACKCWKCIFWSALGLVTGKMHCAERAEGLRGHSLWNGLEPHELWHNRRYQIKFSSPFVFVSSEKWSKMKVVRSWYKQDMLLFIFGHVHVKKAPPS